MDIMKDCWNPAAVATDLILGFCALIAVLLIWRTFRTPDVPTWGRGRKRDG
ncbi:MAG TPA: hypothetical protein VF665_10435 [Longimicrobium sp.]|jgi:hypothetical protein|uniref:hypothetical protein n=1 Tax=Longimicrobium sp. TaxID=2029185 RepID=UPI002EDACCE7